MTLIVEFGLFFFAAGTGSHANQGEGYYDGFDIGHLVFLWMKFLTGRPSEKGVWNSDGLISGSDLS